MILKVHLLCVIKWTNLVKWSHRFCNFTIFHLASNQTKSLSSIIYADKRTVEIVISEQWSWKVAWLLKEHYCPARNHSTLHDHVLLVTFSTVQLFIFFYVDVGSFKKARGRAFWSKRAPRDLKGRDQRFWNEISALYLSSLELRKKCLWLHFFSAKVSKSISYPRRF